MFSDTGIEGTKEYSAKKTFSDYVCIVLSIAMVTFAAWITWG